MVWQSDLNDLRKIEFLNLLLKQQAAEFELKLETHRQQVQRIRSFSLPDAECRNVARPTAGGGAQVKAGPGRYGKRSQGSSGRCRPQALAEEPKAAAEGRCLPGY